MIMGGRLFRSSAIIAFVMSLALVSLSAVPLLAQEDVPESDSQDIHLELNPEIDMSLAWDGEFYEGDTDGEFSIDDDELASFYEDQANFHTVFPPDRRQRITPTTQYPASAITLILTEAGVQCSGTFIGPNVVLTAAHCLYSYELGAWTGDYLVEPGADGPLSPFGYQIATNAWIPSGWVQTGDFDYDVGLLLLPNTQLGNQVGWFDLGIFSTQTLLSPSFNPGTAGYPGDKPDFTMWMTTEPSFIDVNDAQLYNRLDTANGQSGSSVWRNSDGYIAGVQTSGSAAINQARRINEEVVAALLSACNDLNCSFNYAVEQPQPSPQPDPPPQQTEPPPPSPQPPAQPVEEPVFIVGGAIDRPVQNFVDTWARTDYPVGEGLVNRTWMWGPGNYSAPLVEPYGNAPDGGRIVMYFDKTRMEDNQYRASPPWHVTNGLLVMELVTGRMQIGDNEFVDRAPADVQVAGDNHPDSPTYAMLDPLRTWDPIPLGSQVTQRLNSDGSVSNDGSLAGRGVTAAHYVPDTGHNVASVFWNFMNSSGPVQTHQGTVHGPLFENPFFATGFPITEAYWVHVPVGGQWQDVLLQCFERRCLTYTPGNSAGWQVEAGNVGQHYYRWRYGDAPTHP